jgi:hypothetical protein
LVLNLYKILYKKIPPSLLPKSLKVDYCLASEKAEKEWLTYLLWECITPGWTAVFLILSGVWYYWKAGNAKHAGDFAGEKAYRDAANAFMLWGGLNSLVYITIVYSQRKIRFV